MHDRLKMYDEEIVKEIMLSTALCVQEMLLDDPGARQDDVFEFVESNFRHIITETLRAERERELEEEEAEIPEGEEAPTPEDPFSD